MAVAFEKIFLPLVFFYLLIHFSYSSWHSLLSVNLIVQGIPLSKTLSELPLPLE